MFVLQVNSNPQLGLLLKQPPHIPNLAAKVRLGWSQVKVSSFDLKYLNEGLNAILIIITIIIATRPKPAYGRQGLAGLWGQDTDEVSTFLAVQDSSIGDLVSQHSCLISRIHKTRLTGSELQWGNSAAHKFELKAPVAPRREIF